MPLPSSTAGLDQESEYGASMTADQSGTPVRRAKAKTRGLAWPLMVTEPTAYTLSREQTGVVLATKLMTRPAASVERLHDGAAMLGGG